jgi:uncharacterized protein (TIGR00296 family)
MPTNENSNVGNDEVTSKKLVASLSMCYFCFDTLIDALQNPNRSIRDSKSIPDFLKDMPDPSVNSPLFVTWEKCDSDESSWKKRGCIGCLSPRPLATDVAEYALISAFQDRRFNPISLDEVQSLRVRFSLLSDFENCEHVHDWTIGVHGIFINFEVDGKRFDATFLPDVIKTEGWDHALALSTTIRKTGYDGDISPELLNRIHCTRYQSTLCQATYREYMNSK